MMSAAEGMELQPLEKKRTWELQAKVSVIKNCQTGESAMQGRGALLVHRVESDAKVAGSDSTYPRSALQSSVGD